jgi:hypothetical protein
MAKKECFLSSLYGPLKHQVVTVKNTILGELFWGNNLARTERAFMQWNRTALVLLPSPPLQGKTEPSNQHSNGRFGSLRNPVRILQVLATSLATEARTHQIPEWGGALFGMTGPKSTENVSTACIFCILANLVQHLQTFGILTIYILWPIIMLYTQFMSQIVRLVWVFEHT